MDDYDKLKLELKEIAKILKEFPEALQSEVFQILTSNFLENPLQKQKPKDSKAIGEKKAEVSAFKGSKSKNRTSGPTKQSYSIVKSLSLKGDSKIESFKDFCTNYDNNSGIKFTVLSVYYLSRILKISDIGLDHIYTCYKELGRKLPKNLKQNVYDCSGPRYGYLDASNINDLKIPTSGEDFVEHDLKIEK